MAFSSRLGGLSVLVLEDKYLLAEDVRRELVRAQAEVIGPFAAAAKALAAADRQNPDCALLDLNLQDGIDFEPARTLRARGVHVIFLTGYDKALLPDDLRNAGFVQKPVRFEHMVEAVASACGR
jgi:DNA-binding NarL/FixJ family response regulator